MANILDLDAESFESALKELSLEPASESFLREEWSKKNTLTGKAKDVFSSATQLPEGKKRASVLPMVYPEGSTGWEALASGKAEFGLPESVLGSVEAPLSALETGEKAAAGLSIPREELQSSAFTGAAVASGGGLGFKVPEGATRLFGGKIAKNADFSAYQKAKRMLASKQDPETVWKETGWARNKKGELRFEIDDDEFQYSGVPNPREYYYVGDVVNHQKFFDNYPKVKEALVSEQLLEDDLLGYIDFTSDTPPRPFIVINQNLSKKEKESTLLHELQHLIQSIEDPGFNKNYEFNRVLFGYEHQPEEVEAELVPNRLKLKKEDRKNIVPKFAKGGLTMDEQMKKLFAEGGVNTGDAKVDPVSGNEVPPGSMPSEVRDDVDAKLSGGEYVVPADVLRFYGVAFFEKLRKKAKEGLAEMDADGRIGGGSVEEEEDDFPFSVDELEAEDDMAFAEGGLLGATDAQNPESVKATGFNPNEWTLGDSATGGMGQTQVKRYKDKNGNIVNVLFINGKPVVDVKALGYTEYTEETPAATGEEVKAPETSRESPRDSQGRSSEGSKAVDPTENYYNMAEKDLLNPNYSTTFGEKASGLAKAASLLSPGIGLGVGAIKGFQDAQNLADARARSIVAKERGLNTAALDAVVADLEKNASGFVKGLDLVGLDGVNIAKQHKQSLGITGPTATTTPGIVGTTPTATSSRSSGMDSFKATMPSATGTVEGTSRGVTQTRTGVTSDGGYSGSRTTGSAAPTSSPSPRSRSSSTSSRSASVSSGSSSSAGKSYGGRDINSDAYSGKGYTSGRAKGGLVQKPQKKKK